MKQLTHLDRQGDATMVNIAEKEITHRLVVATGRIHMSPEAFKMLVEDTLKKGNALGVARIAGIMAAKQTSSLIPLCHQVGLTNCSIEFSLDKGNYSIEVRCRTETRARTGVEMEALTGVSIALLSIYDMCKSVDRTMRIDDIRVIEKSGGKSGEWKFSSNMAQREPSHG